MARLAPGFARNAAGQNHEPWKHQPGAPNQGSVPPGQKEKHGPGKSFASAPIGKPTLGQSLEVEPGAARGPVLSGIGYTPGAGQSWDQPQLGPTPMEQLIEAKKQLEPESSPWGLKAKHDASEDPLAQLEAAKKKIEPADKPWVFKAKHGWHDRKAVQVLLSGIHFKHEAKKKEKITKSRRSLKVSDVTIPSERYPSTVPPSPPGGGPVHVEFACTLLDVSEVNGTDGTCFIDMMVVLWWADHRLIGMDTDSIDFKDHWRPKPVIVNAKGKVSMHDDAHCKVRDSSRGFCRATYFVRGTIWITRDFHDFPWDSQVVEIAFETRNFDIDHCVLHAARVPELSPNPILFDMEFNRLVSYKICGCGLFEDQKTYATRTYSRLVLCVFIQRHPTTYVWKVILLMTLSTVAAFGNTMCESISRRFGLLMACYLTNGSLLQVTNSTIPKLSYLTALDRANVVAFFMIFAMVLEAAVAVLRDCDMTCSSEGLYAVDREKIGALVCVMMYFLMATALITGPFRRWSQFMHATDQDLDAPDRVKMPNEEQDMLLNACRTYAYITRSSLTEQRNKDLEDRYHHIECSIEAFSPAHKKRALTVEKKVATENEWATASLLESDS